MAATTGISWADATVNFWHGCHKVSAGCKYCYMFREKDRWNKDGSFVLKTQPETINNTITDLVNADKRRKSLGITDRIRIFTCSYSDFFIEEADPWRKEAWDIIRAYPQFDWLVLSKRLDRAGVCLPEDWGEGWNHVWIGASAEDQKNFDARWGQLQAIPARLKFISAEPLLSPIFFALPFIVGQGREICTVEGFKGPDWVIIGGESGNDHGPWQYRSIQWQHIEGMVRECKQFNIPVFVKQLGTGQAKALKLKDRTGATMEQWPEELNSIKIRQFPKSLL